MVDGLIGMPLVYYAWSDGVTDIAFQMYSQVDPRHPDRQLPELPSSTAKVVYRSIFLTQAEKTASDRKVQNEQQERAQSNLKKFKNDL